MKVFSPFLNGNTTTSGSFNVPNHPGTGSIPNPLTGSLFHDATDGILKIYTGTQWVTVGEQTSPVVSLPSIEYLLVAGGGGGADAIGGGGGAGGFLSSSLNSMQSGSSITVTVGAGGTGGVNDSYGTNGVNSSIASAAGTPFVTVTSIGGGHGGVSTTVGDGGSGGGGSGLDGTYTGGSGTAGQGFDGGTGAGSSGLTDNRGGGGGGASEAGTGGKNITGDGGDGKQSSITGTATYYAGGGGGSKHPSAGSYGAGGLGGGGNGDVAGTANTGGGGGGSLTDGRAGGSGVAIFAYNTGSLSGLGGIKTLNGGRMVHTFNSSGTLTIAGTGEYPVANGSVFAPVIYTGNGSTQSITSVGFQPDLVWIKRRSSTEDHAWFDSVRGIQRQISSNLTAAGYTTTNAVSSFDSNGFTTGNNGATNTSSQTYVAWCWKAGGAAVSNTDGTITSQVSANTTAGFSIVKYFGGNISNTYGHGLDSAPELIIIKNLDIVRDWSVVGTGLGGDGGDRLVLNDTVGKITTTGLSGTTATTFAFEHDNSIANSANNFIAYCFHSVDSYQKVGSYTGDNSTSGNIITTGFQPRFLMTKRIDTNGYNWYMWDSVRSPTNPRDKVFYADGAGAEYDFSAYPHNFLSNGFEVATNNAAFNALNGTYIYLAIA